MGSSRAEDVPPLLLELADLAGDVAQDSVDDVLAITSVYVATVLAIADDADGYANFLADGAMEAANTAIETAQGLADAAVPLAESAKETALQEADNALDEAILLANAVIGMLPDSDDVVALVLATIAQAADEVLRAASDLQADAEDAIGDAEDTANNALPIVMELANDVQGLAEDAAAQAQDLAGEPIGLLFGAVQTAVSLAESILPAVEECRYVVLPELGEVSACTVPTPGGNLLNTVGTLGTPPGSFTNAGQVWQWNHTYAYYQCRFVFPFSLDCDYVGAVRLEVFLRLNGYRSDWLQETDAWDGPPIQATHEWDCRRDDFFDSSCLFEGYRQKRTNGAATLGPYVSADFAFTKETNKFFWDFEHQWRAAGWEGRWTTGNYTTERYVCSKEWADLDDPPVPNPCRFVNYVGDGGPNIDVS